MRLTACACPASRSPGRLPADAWQVFHNRQNIADALTRLNREWEVVKVSGYFLEFYVGDFFWGSF